MASPKSSSVGVISPKLFWSAHENELRVHNAVDLERHVGHGTSGLPEQALFRFCATGRGAPALHHAAVDEVGTGRRLSDGGDRLMVRDVESVELGDGRTVLICLVSSPGLKSEIHCVDPVAGETLGVTTGLSIMLTKLAMLPKGSLCARGMAGSGAGNDDRRFVIAVGGIVGRVEIAGVQAEADSPRDQPEAVPGSALVPREREGVPVSALVAFAVKGRGKRERIMIAAGWEDGQWSVRQYFDGDEAGVNGKLAKFPEPGLEMTGDTRGSGPVLHIVHQPDDSGPGTLEEPSAIRLWLCNAKGLLLYEVPLGSSPDAAAPPSPHLLRAHLRNLVPDTRPQCLRAMAVGGGLPRELFAFACLRSRDSTPVLQVLDISNTSAPSTVAPSKAFGGTDPANPLEDTSRERSLSSCRARAPVADPTEVVIGAENRASEEAVVEEVELSTRCCGNSVVSARLHAVWVNPADAKIFVSGRRGIGSELVGAEQRRRRPPMGSPGAEEGGDLGADTRQEGGETREKGRSDAAAGWRRSTVGGHGKVEKLHLKMSIMVGEASLSETGRLRVRAWQYSHLGDAHRVAMEAEKLGHLGFYDPSQEVWDTATKRLVTSVGEETLEHVIGGGSRGDLDDGAGKLWGQPRYTTVPGVNSGDPDLDVAQRSVGTVVGGGIRHRPHVTCDTGSGGYWLAARLQGAVMLGRGPEIARALTASATDVGDWMLRRARPVQEWALAVTEEAWDEVRVFFEDETLVLPDGSARHVLGRLDVLARRAKQLERILDASVRRCQVTCEASAAEVAAQSGVRKSVTLRRHGNRVSAMSTLRTRLEHAMVAALLTSSLASAASFLIGRGAVAADDSSSLGVVRSVTVGVSPTGVRDESSVHSAADEGIVGARCRSGDECGSNSIGGGLTLMRDRLLQLAGVVPGELRLYEMLRRVSSMVFDSFPWVNTEDAASSVGRLDTQRAIRVLEAGLAALAYSVMTGASSSLDAPRDGGCYQPGAGKERFALEAAERELDFFGEQVQLSSEARVRARLSWLLDRGRTSRAALLAAGSALLCPRAILSVAGDRVLAERAAANLMARWRQPAEEEEEEEKDAGRKKRSASAFAPLVEELLRLARANGETETILALEREKHGADLGTEGVASRAPKRSRHSFPPDSGTFLSAVKRSSPEGDLGGELEASVADGRGLISPEVNGNGNHGRVSELEMEQNRAVVGERRREQGVTPLSGGRPWHAETFLPSDGTDSEVVDDVLSVQTKAVGEHTPGSERLREIQTPSSGDGDLVRVDDDGDKFFRRRERGQTVWQTPRGVGFTPTASRNGGGGAPIGAGTTRSRKRALDIARRYHRTPTSSMRGVGSPGDSPAFDSPAIDHDVGSRSSLRFSSPDDSETPEVPRRNRGQTVWETPRGVGLTPKALAVSQLASRPIGFTPKGGRVKDDGRGSKAASAHRMLSRMRGQTMWQTPRGVGLTPRTPSHALRGEDHDAGAASGNDKVTEGASETKMSVRWEGRGDIEASPMESPPLGQSAFRSFAEGN